jgi:L-seryl-tRNA(Ser) seleniumtransferase
VDGVTAEIRKPTTIANNPGLSIRWSTAQLGITGQEVARVLFSSGPRIAVSGGRAGGQGTEAGISLEAYMMAAVEEKVVADRIHSVLSNGQKSLAAAQPKPPVTDLIGEWLVSIAYPLPLENRPWF